MMHIRHIKNAIIGRKPGPLDIRRFYAVLLPLVEIDKELHILYEVRASHLKVQPGEVCFPGGAIEEGETPVESAVRETFEEIGISPDMIDIIGELDYLHKAGNYLIYPFAGVLKCNISDIRLNRSEVDDIFTVPLKYLLSNEPDEHIISYKVHTNEDFPYEKIKGNKKYKWRKMEIPVYFYEYDDRLIWGMTAKITKSFIDLLNLK